MASFAQTTNAAFDIAQMTNLLEHDNRETRSALKELFKDLSSRHVMQLPFLRSASLLWLASRQSVPTSQSQFETLSIIHTGSFLFTRPWG